MEITINPNEELALKIKSKINSNGGFCISKPEHTPESKCLCDEFLYGDKLGLCDCGLYIKREV